MKKFCLFIAFLFLVILSSCGPSISTHALQKETQPLLYNENVTVYTVAERAPEEAEVIGIVKIGDTGLTLKCGYDFVIETAVLEARKIGGNAIKITSHEPPDFWSSCHRITANILRIKK